MGRRADQVIRRLTFEEWDERMQRGEGSWMRFDIAATDGEFLVMERSGKLLAYLQHRPHEHLPGVYVLSRLETHPYYRRRGYARRLVEHVIHQEERHDVTVARGVQTSALGFWRRLGFVPDGYGPDLECGMLYSEGNFVWQRASLSEGEANTKEREKEKTNS